MIVVATFLPPCGLDFLYNYKMNTSNYTEFLVFEQFDRVTGARGSDLRGTCFDRPSDWQMSFYVTIVAFLPNPTKRQ